MAALYMICFSLILASSITRTKAISVYGLRGNAGTNAVTLRSKRQTHPAVTVARFPELPASSVADRPDEERNFVPEPIDYLTPPKPPELADVSPLTEPPGPIPSRLPDRDSETKWRLGFDASEILNPPADPFSLLTDNGYTTINNIILRTDGKENEDLNHQHSTAAPEISSDNTGIQFLGRINEPINNLFDSRFPFSNENDFTNFNDKQNFFDKRQTDKSIKNRQRRISIYDEDEDTDHQDHEDGRDVEYLNAEDHPEEDHKKKSAGHVITFVKTDKHGHFKWGVRQHGIV